MVIRMKKVIGNEVVHYLEVGSILHHLAYLHQVGDWAVVAHKILLIFLV